jgi:hypothetical protein
MRIIGEAAELAGPAVKYSSELATLSFELSALKLGNGFPISANPQRYSPCFSTTARERPSILVKMEDPVR